MPRVVRLGDPGSHGGAVTTGSPDTFANGLKVARVGDTYSCPIHGDNPITSGSPDTYANGQRVARVGDSTACGATLTDGSPDTYCN
jgi:uncharacterized Zn-binding protein involved in type VI secretion